MFADGRTRRGALANGRMERAGNGARGKRCDIDGPTQPGELAGASESSRDIDHKTRGARVRARAAIESIRRKPRSDAG